MTSIVRYPYDENMISNITEWNYGTNWPVVYIWYNGNKAYVGETLDAVRRTKEHMAEKEFDEFENICLISDKTFNKSVILDLPSGPTSPIQPPTNHVSCATHFYPST